MRVVEEAAALRRARGMGYRTQVFNLLQQALQLDTPDKDIDRLRDEAVACLGDFVGLEPITWEDFPAGIQKIALTPDGGQMAIALDNGTIELRNVSTGGVVAQLSESAVGLGFDPANRWLVTAGAKGTIKVWPDYGTGATPAAQTIEMRADFAGMARNGRFAVAYSQQKDGGLLSLWDVARQEVKARLKVPSGEPEGPVQVSDDGQWVAVKLPPGKASSMPWCGTPRSLTRRRSSLQRPTRTPRPCRSLRMEDSWRASTGMTGSFCSMCASSAPAADSLR